MRWNPSKILVVTLLGTLAPLAARASARVHQPAAKAAVHAAPAAATKHGRKAEVVAVRGKAAHGKALPAKAVKAKPQTKPQTKAELRAEARAEARADALEKANARRHPARVEAVAVSRHKAAPVVEPVAEAEPEPVAPALPEIHVTHDRKQHFAPAATQGDAGSVEDAGRGKASVDDFMTPDGASAPLAEVHVPAPIIRGSDKSAVAAVRQAAARKPAPASVAKVEEHVADAAAKLPPPAKPVPVVTVARKTEKPALAAPEAPARTAEVAPIVLPALLYNKHGKLIVPAAMKGSHDILVHQNVMADVDGLDRIQDDEDLERMRAAKLLVALPDTEALSVDERLPGNRRYARPWTVAFLNALGKAHYGRFHSALQVNSAVRTVEFQLRLMRTNGNAAPAEGETASPHLTGQAVDIAKHGLSTTEIAWMRGYLLPLVQEGKIDVEEEFQQACFHISVYKKYVPQASPKRVITPHTSAAAAIATAIH